MSESVSADGIAHGGGANPMPGFSIVNADDLDAALEIAKTCPFLETETSTVVVSEQMEMRSIEPIIIVIFEHRQNNTVLNIRTQAH